MQRYKTILVGEADGRRHFVQIPISELPTMQEPVPVIVKPRRRSVAICDLPITDEDPLATYIAKRGGIDPHYNRGQWRHELRMILERGKGVLPGLLNHRARLTLEELAEACADEGYLYTADVDELLFALAKDCEAAAVGNRLDRVYSYRGQETVGVELAWQEHCLLDAE